MRKSLIVCLLSLFCSVVIAANKHYVVVVSLDGVRWDYAQFYPTPFFHSMAKKGVEAIMRPSFPSKTFPNHYTLATGLYPDHHGIVANSFLDRVRHRHYSIGNSVTRNDTSYYKGEPIWNTYQRQGGKSACVYWVGSDIPINGSHPDSYLSYEEAPLLTFSQRVDRVIDLLSKPESERPHLVMAYFEEPDHSGHGYGPQGRQTANAVALMDSLMNELYNRIQKLPIAADVDFIVTGDHGMTSVEPFRTVSIKTYLKKSWINRTDGDVPTLIYVNPGCTDSIVSALKGVPHIQAWKKNEIPAYLHYGSNPNIGDVVVLPDIGWLFTDGAVGQHGTHGFDPTFNDMQVMFRAIGPDFKTGYTKQEPFRNVDIYSLLAHLLNVKPAPNDGDITEVEDLLNPSK